MYQRYWAFKNAWSVDGLPGLQVALKTAKEEKVAPIEKMVGPQAPKHYRNDRRFGVVHLVLVAIISALFTALSLAFAITRGVDLSAHVNKLLG